MNGIRAEFLRQIHNDEDNGAGAQAGPKWHLLERHSRLVEGGLIDNPPSNPLAGLEATPDLSRVRDRQVEKLIALGFHTVLGATPEEYAESMPEFPQQPPEYAGVFDVPLLVDTRVDPRTQTDLISANERFGSFIPLHEVRDQTPQGETVYAGWTHVGRKDPKGVLSTLADALAMRIHYPHILEKPGVVAAGSLLPRGTRRFREGGLVAIDPYHISKASWDTERPRLTRGAQVNHGTPLPPRLRGTT